MKTMTAAERAMWFRLKPHGYTSVMHGERYVLALDPLGGGTVLTPLSLAVKLEAERELKLAAKW